MSFIGPTTGLGGGIAWLKGTSTPLTTSEPCDVQTTLSGSPTTYPALQIYRVTARAHSVLDPRVPLVVKNSAAVVKSTDYYINFGTGEIVFYTPLTGTPAITLDGNYIPTTSGTDVHVLQHVNNWKEGTTAAQIPADEYGKRIIPTFAGKLSGTFSFDYYSSSDTADLMTAIRLRTNYFVLALFEDLVSNRMRIIYCNLGGTPIDAPSAGMVGGNISGGLFEDVTLRVEALV
jgi:hypothetical protein